MSYFVRVWEEIKRGQHLDIYITVAIAITTAILGILGVVNSNIIFSTVLATLALVSSSLLGNRRDNEDVREALLDFQRTVKQPNQFFVLEYNMEELIQQIRNCEELYLWGTALEGHIPLLRDHIKQGLQTGLKVRCLLIEPYSDTVKMAAFRGKLKEETLNSILTRNLSILDELSKQTLSGKLEYRVINYLAPYTMYVFDPHLAKGHLLAPLSTFRVSNIHSRPTIKLTRKDSEIWFTQFVQQFELVWNESNSYKLENK